LDLDENARLDRWGPVVPARDVPTELARGTLDLEVVGNARPAGSAFHQQDGDPEIVDGDSAEVDQRECPFSIYADVVTGGAHLDSLRKHSIEQSECVLGSYGDHDQLRMARERLSTPEAVDCKDSVSLNLEPRHAGM
jgi:hypothetical protein